MKRKTSSQEYLDSIEMLDRIHERMKLERQLALPQPPDRLMIEEMINFQREEDEVCMSTNDPYYANHQLDV